MIMWKVLVRVESITKGVLLPQEYHSHRYTTFTEIPHDQGYDTHVTVSQFTVTRSQIKNH